MPSSGFALSALPIAPSFPTGLGTTDSEAQRRALAQQLEVAKQLANYTAQQKATQAKLALSAQTDTANANVVDAAAEDALAGHNVSLQQQGIKSNVLSQAGNDLTRSGVLAAQAGVGQQEAAINQQKALSDLRNRSKAEIPDVQRRFAEAAQLADHDAEANALEKIEQDYPWIGQLPEYKDQHELLKGHITSARQRALELQKNNAAQARAETIAGSGIDRAKISAQGGVDKAVIAADAKEAGSKSEAERQADAYIRYNQLATAATDPDDQAMYEERARVAKQRLDVLNTAKAAPGAVQAQKAQMGAQHAIDAADANSARMGDLIDRILPRVTRGGGAGIGSVLSVIPESDARALKADVETLKANIGFNELNTLRQQSPTGGALGQVSEKELHFLQSVIGSLDTSLAPDVLRANLVRAKEAIQGSAKRLHDAYERDFGGAQAAAGAAPTGAAPAFTSEAEAEQAAKAGRLKSGDKITINGQSGTWH